MAITVAVKVLDGYPQSVGAKIESIAKLTLSGTYTFGGFHVEAVSFGMQYVEHMSVSVEQRNYVEFGNWQPDAMVPAAGGQYIILQNVADGSEVTAGQDLTGDIYVVHVRGF